MTDRERRQDADVRVQLPLQLHQSPAKRESREPESQQRRMYRPAASRRANISLQCTQSVSGVPLACPVAIDAVRAAQEGAHTSRYDHL